MRDALTLVAVASLVMAGAVCAAPLNVRAPELKMQGAAWQPYNMGDSPEGGYMGWLRDQATSTEGEVTLPATLQPGAYFFFVKALNYGERVSIQLACGGGKSEVVLPRNRDWNGPWTDRIPLQVNTAAGRLTIVLSRAGNLGNADKLLLRGLYITDDANAAVDENDTVIHASYPAAMDDSPAVKGNLIPNSSFEAGLGHGWGFLAGGAYSRDYSINDLWDKTQAHDGQASVRVPGWGKLISRVLRVGSNKKHTLSLWARPPRAGASLQVNLYSVHDRLAGLQPVTRLQQKLALKEGWQRVSLVGYLRDYPTNEYQVRLETTDTPVWVDALQLEEGDLTDYQARQPLEIGLVCDKPANILFEDEAPSLQLLVRNSSGRAITATVRYEVYDTLNRRVKEGSLGLTVPADATRPARLDVAAAKRGAFRIVAWVEGADDSEEEVVYAVVPRPRVAGPDPDSMIGVHANASDFQYEALGRLGVKWQRILSPMAWFRWSIIEPEPGKFIWHDEDARKTLAHGYTTLGNISECPKWADRGGKPDMEAWENAVYRIVDHYKPWVTYWEVWNEPIYPFDPATYAEVLRRASRAIRRADPQAKIVGMGGSYKCDWCLEVTHQLGDKPLDYMDYLATHLYPAKADPLNPANAARSVKDFHDKIIVPYNLPVWNTETGAWCLGFYQGPNSGFRSPGEPLWPHQDGIRYYRGATYRAAEVARNFLHSMGSGFSRYFYYDSRFHASPDYYKTHCTLFEYDDTIRPKGVAYGILAYLFDHSRGLGNISPDAKVWAYLFDRGGTPLVALFSADERNRAVTLALPGGRIRALDMMGNPLALAGGKIVCGLQPVYLEGQGGITVAEMKAAVERATVADAADTTPPNVSISDAPRGETRRRSFLLRWIAIDDTSVPYDNTCPEAILYSYRLVGRDAGWSAWSPGTWMRCRDLKPGPYRFEVKAKDAAGNVSENAAVREFVVVQ